MNEYILKGDNINLNTKKKKSRKELTPKFTYHWRKGRAPPLRVGRTIIRDQKGEE